MKRLLLIGSAVAGILTGAVGVARACQQCQWTTVYYPCGSSEDGGIVMCADSSYECLGDPDYTPSNGNWTPQECPTGGGGGGGHGTSTGPIIRKKL
jgi:hypothetical protein